MAALLPGDGISAGHYTTRLRIAYNLRDGAAGLLYRLSVRLIVSTETTSQVGRG